MDLNLIVEAEDVENVHVSKVIRRAFEFGYECVAINTIVECSNLAAKHVVIPEPRYISFEGKPGKNFKILNRITGIIKESIHAHNFLRNANAKKYDIIAVQPVGEKMLHHVCTTLNVDIISMNLTESLGFTLKRSHLGLAIEKNVCFEISYAPCLRDQSAKRRTISNAQLLVDAAKSRNVIICSGALKPLELRSPDDVANLGLLFGLKKNQAIEAVRKNAHIVFSHAGTRKETGCGFVSITGILRLPKQQGWIISACKVPKLSDNAGLSKGGKEKIDDEAAKQTLNDISKNQTDKRKVKEIEESDVNVKDKRPKFSDDI